MDKRGRYYPILFTFQLHSARHLSTGTRKQGYNVLPGDTYAMGVPILMSLAQCSYLVVHVHTNYVQITSGRIVYTKNHIH